MFIIFNKEYRKFEAITSDLLKKMKKSTRIMKTYVENAEVYELDTVDIVFEIGEHKVLVKDGNGTEIISLDCHYDRNDELQDAKCHLFSGLLKEARATYDKRIAKANKLIEAKKAEEAKQKVISVQQAKEKMLNDALEKLRNL